MTDMEYALEWYRYGLDKGDDSVIRFMMHWIAFNWLYSECQQGDDAANIRAFCRENYERLSRYDAFSTGEYPIFEQKPVTTTVRGEQRNNGGLLYSLRHDSGEKRVESLLLTIYHVRCNLFHGSKSLRIQRDVELVRSSATIMEGYLKALLLDDRAS